MAATLAIPFDERLSIGEQVRWVRQRRLRRAAIKRVAIAAIAAVTMVAALTLLWRPSDPGWSVSSNDGRASVTISEESNTGARFTGLGINQVTTPALFEAGQRIAVFGGGEPRFATANDEGRLHFTVDLTGNRSYSYPVQSSAGSSTVHEAFVSFLRVPGGANVGAP